MTFRNAGFFFAACIMILTTFIPAQSEQRVVFVDSYHEGYEWSDGVTRAVRRVFENKAVDLTILRMDSKRNTSKTYIRKVAQKARDKILAIKPDLIIASDDNASRYLIMPYFKNVSTPVLFCGINWDAGLYGYPYINATGMVEVCDLVRLFDDLKTMAKGPRIGYIAADVLTARKDLYYIKMQLNQDITSIFATHFNQWVTGFKSLQAQCDILIIGNSTGINDWDEEKAMEIAHTNTRIPTGAVFEYMTDYAIIGYVKDPEEQGEWAARTALDILGGKQVSGIPMAKNKRFFLILNKKIAEASGFTLADELLSRADRIIE